MRRFAATIGLFVGLLCPGAGGIEATAASRNLPITTSGLESRGCRVEKTPAGLRVVTGTDHDYPGITLPVNGSDSDLSAYLRVEVALTNTGERETTFCCRVDNEGADGINNCVNGNLVLKPGASGVLEVPLPRGNSGKPVAGKLLFGMRGYPVEFGDEVIDQADASKTTFDPAKVNALVIFAPHPTHDGAFEITHISATGTASKAVLSPDALFPLIDTFGQYIHRDWPGKTHSLDELHAYAQAEQKELPTHPGPADWDHYGGWNAGPTLARTGFFRVEKYKDKWWLVDPDGKLFFSNGINCVDMREFTATDEREKWFEDFPGNQPEFRQFGSWGNSSLGYYAGRRVRAFSFEGANLLRRFGNNWKTDSANLAVQRLRSWGINTVGNWSNRSVTVLQKVPYALSLNSDRGRMIEGSNGYWGKFIDPFDPNFRRQFARGVQGELNRSIGDPWCIGFFVGNELSWASSGHDETSLSLAALKSPPDQPAKQAFVAELKKKYSDISALNRAWDGSYASWDALLQSRAEPDLWHARADLAAFYTRIAEAYFSTVRDVLRATAPHQLYLGCRFASTCPRARAAAVKYCDVVSFNLYTATEAGFSVPEGDVPVLIGEFHFGALDRGMFHAGLVPAANQDARAAAYAHYVRGALSNPAIVGCHWFQYQDEPTTGRVFDGENYQIGFVDIVNNPYREIVQAARDVGYTMYAVRLGSGKN